MAGRITAYLILLGFLLGNIFRISLFRPEIKVSFLDLAVILIYFVAFFKNPTRLRSSLISSKSQLIFVLWLFITWIVGSNQLSIPESFSGFTYLLRYCLYIFSFYPLKIIFTQKDSKNLITALAYMFPIIGLVQYLWFPDLRLFTLYGWDMHYFRVFGTYLDPGYFGLILFWSLVNLHTVRYWVFGYLVFSYTYSRSSFLAFLLGYVYLHLKNNKILGSILIGFLMLATIILLPRGIKSEGVRLERTNSVNSRYHNWQDTFKIFQTSPMFGIGFNLLRFQYQNQPGWQTSHASSGSDSSFMFVLVTSGIIGLFLYLNFLKAIWLFIRKNHTLSAFFLGIIIHSFFLNSQFYTPLILLFSLGLRLTVDN